MHKKIVLSLLLAICLGTGVSAQQYAVKTNLLFWATGTPNIGAEVALSDHSTVSLSASYNPWTFRGDNKLQHWFIQPEYRYWISEKFTRSFFGVHLIGGGYEVGGFKLPLGLAPSMRANYYKGWAVGLGVSYGYSFYISPHWNLETSLGVGYARTSYKLRSVATGRESKSTARNYFGPTQASITFVYLFNSKK